MIRCWPSALEAEGGGFGCEPDLSDSYGPYFPSLEDVQAAQGEYIERVQDLGASRAEIRAASLAADLTLRAYSQGLEISPEAGS